MIVERQDSLKGVAQNEGHHFGCMLYSDGYIWIFPDGKTG